LEIVMNNEGIFGALVGAGITIGTALLWNAIGGRETPTEVPQTTLGSIEVPKLCTGTLGSSASLRMLKVGTRATTGGGYESFVLPDPKTFACNVHKGDVVTWAADTNVTKMTIRFVEVSNGDVMTVPCASADLGPSLNPNDADELEASSQFGVVSPRSTTVADVKNGNYYYCVKTTLGSSGGWVWTPNPAIIVKE
jgi:hypothetical protein